MRDVTHFVTLDKDGFITGQHAGDFKADFSETPYADQKRVKIPREVRLRVGDKLSYYDEDFKRKTDKQLIDEGLIALPDGYKLHGDHLCEMTTEECIICGQKEPPAGMKVEGGEIVPMTQIERIQAGIDTLPKGTKIVGDKLEPLTLTEQLAAGQITQDEYDGIINSQNRRELNNRLAEYQSPESLAEAELDETYAAERKAKMRALLLVKKQPGWPLAVEWPDNT